MHPVVANLTVIAILAAAVGLAIRSLWKRRKQGGSCSSCSGSGGCAGCSGGCGHHPEH